MIKDRTQVRLYLLDYLNGEKAGTLIFKYPSVTLSSIYSFRIIVANRFNRIKEEGVPLLKNNCSSLRSCYLNLETRGILLRAIDDKMRGNGK